jgi:hypothetical protein
LRQINYNGGSAASSLAPFGAAEPEGNAPGAILRGIDFRPPLK